MGIVVSVCTYGASILALALAIDYVWMLRMRRLMPPGPWPWPVVGNTFSLPDTKPWYLMEELSKRYQSPVITFWIGRKPTVWINDAWAAHDILVKRAGIYCSRPQNLIFAELGAGQWNMLNMYTITKAQRQRFRDHRKLTHLGVGIQQVKKYRGFQDDESKIMAYDLLESPHEFVAHFERWATSVVSIIAFGRRVSQVDDPLITEVIALMHNAAEMAVIAKDFPRLMETFPWLARFPNWMAPWKHGLGTAAKPKHADVDFFYALAEEATERKEDNYSKLLFQQTEKYNLHPLELSGLAANLIGAGADTSASTLITAVLAITAFPETVVAAWEEVDRVVGNERSPSADDDLPYMRALVKEVLRWRSVAVIGGMPHAPTQDDYWNGYLIPKGCWTQGNVWAMHHNEREFPEPDRFNPRRFLETDDARPFPGEKGYMTFGWGRRSCAGQYLAEQGTYLSVCRLIWAFRIGPAVDDTTGKEMAVDIFDYSNGSNWRPNPFKVRMVARNEEIKATIVREAQQAAKDLARYDGETRYRFSTYYA